MKRNELMDAKYRRAITASAAAAAIADRPVDALLAASAISICPDTPGGGTGIQPSRD